jgi:hypothetical protein
MRTLVMVAVVALAAPAAADEVAEAAAKSWLGALRERDAEKLKKATGFPFTEAGIGGNKCKKTAKAGRAEDFAPAAACMIGDAELVEVMPTALEVKSVALKDITNATFKKNMKALSPLAKDHTFVMTRFHGDGGTHEMLLAVKKSRLVTLVLAETTTE